MKKLVFALVLSLFCFGAVDSQTEAESSETEDSPELYPLIGTEAEEPEAEPESPPAKVFLPRAAAAPAGPVLSLEKPYIVTIDAVLDAVFVRRMRDDYSTKKPDQAGSPFKYQGEGDTRAFQTSGFDDGLQGRALFAYRGERVGGSLQFRAHNDVSFTGFWDWDLWLRFGPWFKVLAGNTAQRGQVERYQHFDDFLKTKIDNFGLIYPVWQVNGENVSGNNANTIASFPWGYAAPGENKGFAAFAGTDTADLFIPAGSASRQQQGFLVEFTYAPVTVSASVGGLFEELSRPYKMPWEYPEASATVLNRYDATFDPLVRRGVALAFRAEGARLFNMLTMSAVYKYASSYLAKPKAEKPSDVIEEKVGNHAYGFYANVVTPLPGLGVSAGYSGLYQTWDNPKAAQTVVDNTSLDYDSHILSANKSVMFPIYSGVDLRIRYAGIPNLGITLNNNFSFGNVFATVNKKELFIKGWSYEYQLNEDTVANVENRNEVYFGLYNALGFTYKLTDELAIDLQLANQMGTFTLYWEKDPIQSLTNNFGIYHGATFTIIEKNLVTASIRGGLDLKLSSYSYQSPADAKTHKAGYMDFGIPIGLKLEF